jgi:UDP-galactopyranose mutase
VNYPGDETFTRISEYKHLTGQTHPFTTLTYEYPTDIGDPYYPVPCEANRELYRKYQELANRETDVYFVGRLATYQYYNMDQVVGQALSAFRRIQAEHPPAIANPADARLVSA